MVAISNLTLEEVIQEAVFEDMETYISRRNNIVAQFIATRSILDVCLGMDRHPGVRVAKWWWYQERIDPVGVREEAATGKREEADRSYENNTE